MNLRDLLMEMNQDITDFADTPLYVLTNESRLFGAAAIVDKKVLESFAKEHGSGFYIIPSSIHEVLLFLSEDLNVGERLAEMVHEVNSTEVSPEEVLSDHVYYFDRKTSELRKAT